MRSIVTVLVVDGDTLVVQGGTTAFNATISEDDIAAQRAADPEAASAEWDGEFRNDLSGFLSDDLIDRAVEHGRPLELPPRRGLRYSAFCDASGGRHDAYAICIAHKDGDCAVVDVVRGVHAPFDPQSVTEEYAKLVKEYGVTAVEGDNYSAEWVASAWSKCGIRYTRSEINKSAIYLETLPLWTRNLIRLPDHPRLLRELRLLERRTHRSGRDSVDHGPRGSDDFANSTCGALHRLASPKPKMFVGTYSQAATGMGVGPPVLPLQAPYNAPEQNACTPGKGINSRPWLDAAAVNFNQRYGLRRPR